MKDDVVKVLHSICQQIWKTQQWPQDWKSSVFIPIPKKGNAKESSNYHTIALISHASKEMLKILQARLQQYVNHELPDVQGGFRKGRGTRVQIANIRSVQFSLSVLSDSFWPHEFQHARPPCPLPTPGVYSKLMSIELVMTSRLLILCRPLLLLPPVPPSIRVFSNESALHMRWPKYWSFSVSISPSDEHPGLISLGWAGWIS